MASHPASVQHRRAVGWDMIAAEHDSSCWQDGWLGDIWDEAAPEEVCPCSEQIFITNRLQMNPGRE